MTPPTTPASDMASVSGLELDVPTILERAAEIVGKPGAWTQGEYAKTADGAVAHINSAEAVCFCMEGAIARAARRFHRDAERVVNDLVGDLMIIWNDAPERTQAEVVAKLREAAALARSSVELGDGK